MERQVAESFYQLLAAIGDFSLFVLAVLMIIMTVKMFRQTARHDTLVQTLTSHIAETDKEFTRTYNLLKEHSEHIGKHYSMIHDNNSDIKVLKSVAGVN